MTAWLAGTPRRESAASNGARCGLPRPRSPLITTASTRSPRPVSASLRRCRSGSPFVTIAVRRPRCRRVLRTSAAPSAGFWSARRAMTNCSASRAAVPTVSMTPSAAAASVQGTRRNTPLCARNQASAGFGAPDSNVAQSDSGEPMPTLSIQVATARGAPRTRRSCHLWRAANCAPAARSPGLRCWTRTASAACVRAVRVSDVSGASVSSRSNRTALIGIDPALHRERKRGEDRYEGPVPGMRGLLPMMPRSFSRARSVSDKPSTPPRTSVLCCPSVGAGVAMGYGPSPAIR